MKKVKQLAGSPISAVKRRVRTDDTIFESKVLPFTTDQVVAALIADPTFQAYRHSEYVHVSDLLYSCMRMVALAEKFNVPIHERPIYDSQGLTFAQGEAIHSYIIGKMIKKRPDIVFGNWKCLCGIKSFIGSASQAANADSCNSCQSKLNQYNEFVVYNNDLMV